MSKRQLYSRKIQSSGSLRVQEMNPLSVPNKAPGSAFFTKGKEVDISYREGDLISQLDENETQTKLPQLSELINLKFKIQDKDLHAKIVEVVKYAQQLENTIKMKDKSIERLEYIIKYFQIGQQKRDIMVQIIQDENRKLKEKISMMDIQMKRSLREVEPDQSQREIKTSKPITKLIQPTQVRRGLLPTRTREIQDDIAQGLLSFDVEDNSQLQNRYSHIPHTQPLIDMLGQHFESFEKNISTMETVQQTQVFDSLHQVLQEHKMMFMTMGHLRALIDMSLQLTQQSGLTVALDIVVKQACECLDSDRASVFVYDAEKEQLWTRALKGQKVIRIPFKKGVAGHVFTSGELLNVMNAYSDQRFDKEADKANHYRTNTILACPIMDPSNTNVIGVFQAVNKMSGYYTKDDEKMIKLIASLTGINLKNSLQFDEQIVYYNSLRHLLTVQENLCGVQNISQLAIEGEHQLKELFNVQHARIFILRKDKMFFYDQGGLNESEINLGLVGDCLINQQFTTTNNPYQNQLYNKHVDIETTLPLYCFPVKNPKQQSEIISVIQVINSKGIQSVSTQQKHKIASLDYEILNNFGQFLAKKILSFQ